MQTRLISRIARRLAFRLMRRPSLAVVQSFSGKPMTLSPLGGINPADPEAQPMIRVAPKSLYTFDGAAGKKVILSIDVELDCVSAEFQGDAELKAMVEQYLREDAGAERMREPS